MDDKLKSTPYTIIPITNDVKDRVVNFLRKFFFRDEPLNMAVGLLDEPNANCTELEEYCLACIPNGMSIMAVSPSGYILGMCLNEIKIRDQKENNDSKINDECANPKCKKILQLLATMNKCSDVFGHFPTAEKLLEIVILSVDESCRGQGICKTLVEKTKEMAIQKNFPLIKVDCTSHFSAKAVSRLGFHCIYTISYMDYVDSEGNRVFKTKSPHSSAKTFVLPLNV
ncbi:hypothetical protein PGB90_005035 [Kerria lacca]